MFHLLTNMVFSVLQQSPEEELCNLLTNIVFSVLWTGSAAEGLEDVVWRERGQVFSVLTKLGSSCQLVRPPDDIKRRSVFVSSLLPGACEVIIESNCQSSEMSSKESK